jgi:hypothetical protein
MAKAKEGDRYICEECGMVVAVEEACGCEPCELVCCDVPMEKTKAAKRPAGKKVSAGKAKAAPRKAGAAAGKKAKKK